jgi:predicted PurR-regulated permease PerM
MQSRGTFVFWFAAFAFVFAALILFRGILLPFGTGLILAYILNPLVSRLEHSGLSRAMATLIIFGGAILALVLVFILLIPPLTGQLSDFLKSLPAIFKSLQDFTLLQAQKFETVLGPIADKLKNLQSPLDPFIKDITAAGAAFIASLWIGGRAVVDVISLLIVTPIVTCYLLYDWDRMIEAVDKYLPRSDVSHIRAMASEINSILAAYLRGQAFICLILGIIYSIGLTVIGLKFSLLIGLGAGLIAFIPYLGSILSLVTALLVALSQFGPAFSPLACVILIFAIGHLIDGYVLQPRFLGRTIGIHPVWLIFALYAFGSLFGFIGVLLAVPMAACLGVFLRHALRYYQNTRLYLEQSKERSNEKARA